MSARLVNLYAGTRQADNFRPCSLQRSHAFGVRLGAHDQRVAIAQYLRCRRRVETRIHHHFQRLTRGLDAAHVELRVIRQQRANAGQNRAATRAQAVHILPRRVAGNPLAVTRRQRRFAVQRTRGFDTQPRMPHHHAFDETDIKHARRVFQQATCGADARFFQQRQAVARHLRIGILHRRHHPHNPRRNQCLGARRGTAMVRTRLQRHVHRRATRRITRLHQSMNFSVRFTGALVPALPHHPAVLDDDAADARIRAGAVHAALSELQRLRHMLVIDRTEHAICPDLSARHENHRQPESSCTPKQNGYRQPCPDASIPA